MKTKHFLLLALGCAIAACAGDSDGDRPGSPAVYDQIAATTDCAELQAGFDRNMDDAERRKPNTPLRTVVLAYADAYDKQLKKAGCYGR